MVEFYQDRRSRNDLFAIVTTVAAFLLTQGLAAFSVREPLVLLIVGVTITAATQGWRAGLLSLGLSGFCFAMFLAPPWYSITMDDPSDRLRLILFLLLACAIVYFFATRERLGRALRSNQELLSLSLATGRAKAWAVDFITGAFWQNFDAAAETYHRTFFASYDALVASVHPDDRLAFMKAVSAAVEAKREAEIKHRVIVNDGVYRWVNTRLQVQFNRSGKARRLVGVSFDA
jgi:K+-sensing histidine kinase KdpD